MILCIRADVWACAFPQTDKVEASQNAKKRQISAGRQRRRSSRPVPSGPPQLPTEPAGDNPDGARPRAPSLTAAWAAPLAVAASSTAAAVHSGQVPPPKISVPPLDGKGNAGGSMAASTIAADLSHTSKHASCRCAAQRTLFRQAAIPEQDGPLPAELCSNTEMIIENQAPGLHEASQPPKKNVKAPVAAAEPAAIALTMEAVPGSAPGETDSAQARTCDLLGQLQRHAVTAQQKGALVQQMVAWLQTEDPGVLATPGAFAGPARKGCSGGGDGVQQLHQFQPQQQYCSSGLAAALHSLKHDTNAGPPGRASHGTAAAPRDGGCAHVQQQSTPGSSGSLDLALTSETSAGEVGPDQSKFVRLNKNVASPQQISWARPQRKV